MVPAFLELIWNWLTDPSSDIKGPPVSHMESVRERYIAVGLSRLPADLLVAGWSQSINAAYEPGWKHWLFKAPGFPLGFNLS